jgi:hypothetical protein
MKKLFLLLALAVSPLLRADNFETAYGTGLVHFDLKTTTTVVFYSAPDTSKRMGTTLTFSYDKKTKTATLVKGNENNWLKPEILDPAHLIFSMRCLEKSGGWFKVVTNNQSGATAYLHAADNMSYNTWIQEIQSAKQITRIKKETNPICKAASSPLTYPWDQKYPDCFRPITILGQWVKIETRSDCADGTTKIKEGWIRWRDDDNLLINYALLD